MAQSLMACGIAPDRAYRIARIVEVELRRGSEPLLTTQELRDLAASVLEREEGDESVSRYRRWHELRHLERPLIVLIGGAPGHRQVDGRDAGRAPARYHAHRLVRRRPPGDARR